ncbi:uncharacterized protein [Pyrus communis]|uniref:uncharacterized protein n=1 Tax=Pyrus communis TaxID=23211 RepID=UPI0035C22E61
MKKNLKESFCDYVKRFKVKKAKIVGCNDSIARAVFQKGFPANHPLFEELIMKEDLTLANYFALAEKHALWDEVRRCIFKANPNDLEYEVPHYSKGDSRSDWTSSHNTPQFVDKDLAKFSKKYGIKQHMSMLRYTHGNGQAEASHKTIIDYLKKSFSGNKGKWPDKLPGYMWAYHTTKQRATGETSFSLALGSKEIILPNVIMPSISTQLLTIERNSKEMATSLVLAEKKREQTITHIVAYQQQFLSSYKKMAKIQQFQPGDLVIRKTFITVRKEDSKKKFCTRST